MTRADVVRGVRAAAVVAVVVVVLPVVAELVARGLEWVIAG